MATKKELSKYMAMAGKKGGKARLKTMTAEQRTEIARKAGVASGKARSSKKKSNQK